MYDSPEVTAGHRERSSLGRNPLSCSKARYYNPQIGRFISEDPLRFDAGVDFYPYVNNQPTRMGDPYGLMPCGSPYWYTKCKYDCESQGQNFLGCEEFLVPQGFDEVLVVHCMCGEPCKKCKACPPTKMPVIHVVPPSRPHYPCKGTHLHYWIVSGQAPPEKGCKCDYKEITLCLE